MRGSVGYLHNLITFEKPAQVGPVFLSLRISQMAQSTTINVSKLVTPAEYARMKYVTPKTVYNWISAGEVPSRTIGNRKFVELR